MAATDTLTNLTIPNGSSASSAIPAASLDTVSRITIVAPPTLDGTVVVEVTVDGSSWAEWTEQGDVITLPAGKAVTIDGVCCKGLRVRSSAAESAERAFQIAVYNPLG